LQKYIKSTPYRGRASRKNVTFSDCKDTDSFSSNNAFEHLFLYFGVFGYIVDNYLKCFGRIGVLLYDFTEVLVRRKPIAVLFVLNHSFGLSQMSSLRCFSSEGSA